MSEARLQPLVPGCLDEVRLIATDMDGTLTREGRFSSALVATLERLRAADLPVLIVTGRSAGWVSALVHYLPVVGAIAENGGLVCWPDGQRQMLVNLPDLEQHRQQLATQFERLQQRFGPLRVSDDNDFRLTDWTFDVAGLHPQTLARMEAFCQDQGWSFCYSNVQCHIKLVGQDKAPGLRQLLSKRWPNLLAVQVLTVGDSPNDASLFDPAFFPCSAGVANVAHYREVLPHLPRWVTEAPEADGFRELVNALATVPVQG